MTIYSNQKEKFIRKPPWLKVKLPSGRNYLKLKHLMDEYKIHTICHEAICPNIGECSGNGIATFLILGDKCTRNCLYCNVQSGNPEHPGTSVNEPERIVKAVEILNLKYVVITSVTRDDLKDGGASAFVNTIEKVNGALTGCKVEVLVPDFKGKIESVKSVVNARPYVFAHNIEVVEEVFNEVRPQGDFVRSLMVLQTAKEIDSEQKTKSGLMIGLGETKKQIINVMQKLRKCDVDLLTIGQYLQPTLNNYPVKKYYDPREFKELEEIGYDIGFLFVKSGPLVRSSYMAEEVAG